MEITIKLANDADRILRTIARNKMEGLAKEIGDEVRHLCPVDTGDLLNTVDVWVDEDSNIQGKAGDDENGVDYARFVENGTYKMMAQPYMRPPFERRRTV